MNYARHVLNFLTIFVQAEKEEQQAAQEKPVKEEYSAPAENWGDNPAPVTDTVAVSDVSTLILLVL